MTNELLQNDKPIAADDVAQAGRRRYYVFSIGGSEYALGEADVIEVRGTEAMIPLRNAPAFVKGAIRLGEALVPIVDMGTILGTPREAAGDAPRVVVVNMPGGTIGMVVDSVSGPTGLQPGQAQALGEFPLGEALASPAPRKRRKNVAAPVLH